VRAPVREVVPSRLPFSDGDRAAVAPWRLEHAKRERVDVSDRKRLGVVCGGSQLGCGLEHPEEVRVLEDRTRSVVAGFAQLVGVGRSVAVRHFDDLEPEARRVGLHNLPHLRVRRLGDHHLRPAGRVLGDEACVRSDRRAVVPRGVRDVHPGQLADRRLVLEDRLEHALAQLRLVWGVRGQELAALEDGVHDRRHVVVVHARAEERQLRTDVRVLRREHLEVGGQLLLGHRWANVELTP